MLYYANPSSRDALAAMVRQRIGYIDTPAQGNVRPLCVQWTADNGCYGSGYPGDEGWLDWLGRNRYAAVRCAFATAPDVVGDAAATVARSRPWLPAVRRLGYSAALVAQNGATVGLLPWAELDVLFLGGLAECLPCGLTRPLDAPPLAKNHRPRCPSCSRLLSEWKEGAAARRLATYALQLGKSVHMGRVSSWRRLEYARGIGCASADGTFLKHGPDKNLPQLLGWARRLEQQCLPLDATA